MEAATADRVRAVIAKLEMSNKDFAEAIGMPVDHLSKALNDKRRFSAYELALIAELGSSTVEWLMTGKSRNPLGLAARAIGLDATQYETEAQQVAARYADAVQVLVEHGAREELPALPKLPTSGLFVDEGRRMAAWALEQLADSHKVLLDSTVELISALEGAFSVDVANATDLPDGFDGLSFQSEHLRLILLLTTENWSRRRFTLAHELGHLLWGDAQHRVLAETLSPGRDQDYTEKRANAFAAAFLMPEDLVRNTLGKESVEFDSDFHKLVATFKVSPSAMAVRLKQLHLVDGTQFLRFREFRARDSVLATEQSKMEAEEITAAQVTRAPAHIIAEFLTLYREGRITSKPLVELTGQPEWIWRTYANDALDTARLPELAEASGNDEEIFVP